MLPIRCTLAQLPRRAVTIPVFNPPQPAFTAGSHSSPSLLSALFTVPYLLRSRLQVWLQYAGSVSCLQQLDPPACFSGEPDERATDFCPFALPDFPC
jgi:hypothetical protein